MEMDRPRRPSWQDRLGRSLGANEARYGGPGDPPDSGSLYGGTKDAESAVTDGLHPREIDPLGASGFPITGPDAVTDWDAFVHTPGKGRLGRDLNNFDPGGFSPTSLIKGADAGDRDWRGGDRMQYPRRDPVTDPGMSGGYQQDQFPGRPMPTGTQESPWRDHVGRIGTNTQNNDPGAGPTNLIKGAETDDRDWRSAMRMDKPGRELGGSRGTGGYRHDQFPGPMGEWGSTGTEPYRPHPVRPTGPFGLDKRKNSDTGGFATDLTKSDEYEAGPASGPRITDPGMMPRFPGGFTPAPRLPSLRQQDDFTNPGTSTTKQSDPGAEAEPLSDADYWAARRHADYSRGMDPANSREAPDPTTDVFRVAEQREAGGERVAGPFVPGEWADAQVSQSGGFYDTKERNPESILPTVPPRAPPVQDDTWTSQMASPNKGPIPTDDPDAERREAIKQAYFGKEYSKDQPPASRDRETQAGNNQQAADMGGSPVQFTEDFLSPKDMERYYGDPGGDFSDEGLRAYLDKIYGQRGMKKINSQFEPYTPPTDNPDWSR